MGGLWLGDADRLRPCDGEGGGETSASELSEPEYCCCPRFSRLTISLQSRS